MKGSTRMMALCPQYWASPSCQKFWPAAKTGPYRLLANCCTRAIRVSRFTPLGGVWRIPIRGFRSMASTMRTQVSPAMTLSASRTII